jgi:hypothetical protein
MSTPRIEDTLLQRLLDGDLAGSEHDDVLALLDESAVDRGRQQALERLGGFIGDVATEDAAQLSQAESASLFDAIWAGIEAPAGASQTTSDEGALADDGTGSAPRKRPKLRLIEGEGLGTLPPRSEKVAFEPKLGLPDAAGQKPAALPAPKKAADQGARWPGLVAVVALAAAALLAIALRPDENPGAGRGTPVARGGDAQPGHRGGGGRRPGGDRRHPSRHRSGRSGLRNEYRNRFPSPRGTRRTGSGRLDQRRGVRTVNRPMTTMTTATKTAWLALGLVAGLVAPALVAAQTPAVQANVVVILAKEEPGTIDPSLAGVGALQRPPFNTFRTMQVLSRPRVTLQADQDADIALPNGRRLRIRVQQVMPDGRIRVRVSINRPNQSDYLPLLQVLASPGDPFFVAGQAHDGGTLVIGITLGS